MNEYLLDVPSRRRTKENYKKSKPPGFTKGVQVTSGDPPGIFRLLAVRWTIRFLLVYTILNSITRCSRRGQRVTASRKQLASLWSRFSKNVVPVETNCGLPDRRHNATMHNIGGAEFVPLNCTIFAELRPRFLFRKRAYRLFNVQRSKLTEDIIFVLQIPRRRNSSNIRCPRWIRISEGTEPRSRGNNWVVWRKSSTGRITWAGQDVANWPRNCTCRNPRSRCVKIFNHSTTNWKIVPSFPPTVV